MVEVIEFKNPVHQKLCITNIKWSKNTDNSDMDLVNLLKSKISHYGLVHSVIAKESTNEINSSNSIWYAYVDMYSEKAMHKAYLHLKDNLIVNSEPCKIKKVKGRRTNYPLAKDKCETLANYYLGFNGWTTEILYHKHESSSEQSIQDDINPSSNIINKQRLTTSCPPEDVLTEKFASAIRLSFPHTKNGSLHVEGVGIGTSEWNRKFIEGKGKALAFASKQSRTAALLDAFSKLLLVIINDGEKVTVEVNFEKTDPFAYNPVWDVPVIKVNEVSYDDGNEDDMRDSDFDGLFSQINKM